MTDTMIERVAASLFEAEHADTPQASAFKLQRLTLRKRYELKARAAIEAMREPSGGMQADMRDAIEPYVQLGLSKLVSDQWQIGRETWAAGIDAALQETKG